MAEKKPAGRPPKYTSVRQIEARIEAYFAACEGHVLTDEMTGKPVLHKGAPVYVDRHPPTVTGLALALGFATRQSLMDYQGKPKFQEAILRAKTRIEQYTEERLFDRDGSAGARFSLQNNFDGWKRESEVTLNVAEEADALEEVRRRMGRGGETEETKRPIGFGAGDPQ